VRVKLRVELRCYLCAEFVGSYVGDPRRPDRALFVPAVEGHDPPLKRGKIRCVRCGGPTYVDEIEPAHA
jgi:hypothetical protein